MIKERPILFNSEMVRAILDGRKTQTRRVLKSDYDEMVERDNGEVWPWREDGENGGDYWYPCPFGKVGDHLWVRETFMDMSGTSIEHRDSKGNLQKYAYATDCPQGSYSDDVRKDYGLKWKPSIHMPRSASRILLEITKIRVERLNDISKADVIAEGGPKSHPSIDKVSRTCGFKDWSRSWFAHTWDWINGNGAWSQNPWVWVIEFKVIEGVAQ